MFLVFRPPLRSAILPPPVYTPAPPRASGAAGRFAEGSPMRYCFADCVLDTQLYTLARAGRVRLLRPKVFQVLQYLLVHRDQVVSREALCTQVWPEQFISDTTLESCIKQARQAIGDSGQAQQLIQTRRGYGYRFIGVAE